MIVLNSIFPVFALIVTGTILKHTKLTNDIFLRTSDKLVYYIFFPIMLFWKIGGQALDIDSVFPLVMAALLSAVLMYILSTTCIWIFAVTHYKAGAFSQSCYRFNTYVGMAVVLTALGDKALHLFGILVGMTIPLINVMAVSTLIWFSDKHMPSKKRFQVTVREIMTNPLIIACLIGFLYSGTGLGFPKFLDNTFRLMTLVTLPLALISIGGNLTFAVLKGHLKPALGAAFLKLLIYPVIGYACMHLFRVSPPLVKIGMIYFALPISTAIYVLSSQLNSDIRFASASIVLSTLLSFVSLSLVLLIFG